MTSTRRLARRRVVATVVSLTIPTVLVLAGGHRGTHAARSLLFPGAGLLGERTVIAAVLAVAAVAATVAWLRWGIDWAAAVVWLGAAAVSFAVTPTSHPPAAVPTAAAAHEFPLVVLVVGALSWLRAVTHRLPGASRLAARRAARRDRHGLADVERLGPVGRSRCAALVALAEADEAVVVAAGTGDVPRRRARRVALAARGRTTGALDADHAHMRAALALTGGLDGDAAGRLVDECRRRAAGVPCSEPGWVRPLDGTLAALAVARLGHADVAARWGATLDGPLGLRRGHRPAWWWAPLGVGAGAAPAWEHATATGLARAAGWIGDDDWASLRPRALGAAARGTARPDDERLVAAGRLWLAFVADETATRVLARPTVRHDPLAVAIDLVARRLAADPDALRPTDSAPAR